MTSTREPAEALPELHLRPSLLDTVRYAAAMWEFQRLHFDHDWARHEGLARSIVQGPLLGNYLVHTVERWVGGDAELESIGWRNHAVVPVDTPLVCGGSAATPDADGRDVTLWIRNDEGITVVTGTARVRRSPAERAP